MAADWCAIDDAPASICNGPHAAHHCPNGDLVVCRFDHTDPCPFCGWSVGDPCPYAPDHLRASCEGGAE